MILVDANLLIYARVKSFHQHAAAYDWLKGVLNTEPRVGLPWPSLLAFLRIVTNPRAFARPMSLREAWSQIEEWLDLPSTWIPLPTERHAQSMATLVIHATRSNHVPDVHLAALAIEHGLTVYSSDGDFARFPNVRWQNPLV